MPVIAGEPPGEGPGEVEIELTGGLEAAEAPKVAFSRDALKQKLAVMEKIKNSYAEYSLYEKPRAKFTSVQLVFFTLLPVETLESIQNDIKLIRYLGDNVDRYMEIGKRS